MEDMRAVLVRAVMRPWLSLRERKKTKAMKAAFDVIRDQTIKSKQRGFQASATILNIALYILIAERDIQCIKIDALTHPDSWRRNLCARVILLTIHEWDFDKVSGLALKRALHMIEATEEARQEAIGALRALREVQRKVRKEFGPLRNVAIAHRDADALTQYKAISDLRTEYVFGITSEFYAAARRFIDVLPKLIAQSGTMSSLLRQWIRSEGN
jgi:hypothetical protein